jgi:hypothetical protein
MNSELVKENSDCWVCKQVLPCIMSVWNLERMLEILRQSLVVMWKASSLGLIIAMSVSYTIFPALATWGAAVTPKASFKPISSH